MRFEHTRIHIIIHYGFWSYVLHYRAMLMDFFIWTMATLLVTETRCSSVCGVLPCELAGLSTGNDPTLLLISFNQSVCLSVRSFLGGYILGMGNVMKKNNNLRTGYTALCVFRELDMPFSLCHVFSAVLMIKAHLTRMTKWNLWSFLVWIAWKENPSSNQVWRDQKFPSVVTISGIRK